ncbi:class I SAM-dependent methyltransferase [Alienimonas sp. DA493]|uniref:class I SAM-dependent methyltransferase n=1 Tax=Alienimonas sp. DA493 TaxID=3373605 RepID=UPI003754675A
MTEPRSKTADGPRCPGCGGDALTDVFAARNQPVHVGIFGATAAEARALPVGDVRLAWCGRCGLIHNRAFEPEKLSYRPGYEVALHHSATFREYLDRLVERLTERFELRGCRAVEIGCGDGYFLRTLAERAGVRGVGVDPTVDREDEEEVGAGSMTRIRGYFDDAVAARLAREPVDFVCCLSVFEHVPRPAAILRAVRTLAASRGAGVYFDVFNARQAFERGEVWSVHYEQCNLFGLDSLAAVFRHAGFDVTDAGLCYADGQYAFVEAVAPPDGGPPAIPPAEPAARSTEPAALPPAVASFAERYDARRAEWEARLADWRARGRTAAFWGAAGKGVTFLNSVPLAEPEAGVIRRVVDSNRNKQGRFLPGAGHPIVAPEALRDAPPDAVVISNALYEREIRRQAASLGLNCEFFVA